MASIDVKEILHLTPQLLNIPSKRVWYSYDDEADVLYLGGGQGDRSLVPETRRGGFLCVHRLYSKKKIFSFTPEQVFCSDMEPIS